MSDSNLQVISAQTEDNLTGIVIDGVPHLYWLNVYKSIGITASHAQEVIKRLTPGKHYLRFSKTEFNEKYPSIHTACIVSDKAIAYYFLTSEGFNRALLEIRTRELKDENVAAAIERKKDHIASIYTRYQVGETLSLATDTTPGLVAEVEPPEQDASYIKFALAMNQFIKKMGAARNAANAITIEMIRENCHHDVDPFLSTIPADQIKTPPDDAVHTRDDVSRILNITVDDLEDKLIEIRWAIRSPRGWLVTPKGSEYLKQDRTLGEKGHARFDINFGLDALHMLKREYTQRLITGGYLSSGSCRGMIPVTGVE